MPHPLEEETIARLDGIGLHFGQYIPPSLEELVEAEAVERVYPEEEED